MTMQAQAQPTTGGGDTLGLFPQVTGENLAGRPFALPREFEGDINLVVVAFKRQQQQDVDTWMPFLKTLARRRPAVRVYEIPTLGRGYRFMRGIIDGGMRSGIPDSATRAATITLYIDKAPFKRSLALNDEDHIYVLLVDRSGHVHARAAGRYEPAAAAALEREFDRAR